MIKEALIRIAFFVGGGLIEKPRFRTGVEGEMGGYGTYIHTRERSIETDEFYLSSEPVQQEQGHLQVARYSHINSVRLATRARNPSRFP